MRQAHPAFREEQYHDYAANRPDGLDECTREMFSLAMLVRMGKVSEEDCRQAFAAFRRLDVNDEGVLNSKSIIAAMIQKRWQAQLISGQPAAVPPPHWMATGF